MGSRPRYQIRTMRSWLLEILCREPMSGIKLGWERKPSQNVYISKQTLPFPHPTLIWPIIGRTKATHFPAAVSEKSILEMCSKLQVSIIPLCSFYTNVFLSGPYHHEGRLKEKDTGWWAFIWFLMVSLSKLKMASASSRDAGVLWHVFQGALKPKDLQLPHAYMHIYLNVVELL